jgi:hypothetical protein
MINTDIDWTQNCLTGGIHHGRDGAIWNIPLNYAIQIYSAETLKGLIIERIHSDARQVAEHSSHHGPIWAQLVRENAEKFYMTTLQHKVGELSNYYKSESFKNEQPDIVKLVKEDKLNPHYAPLHSHDTLNLFCRILGSKARNYIDS